MTPAGRFGLIAGGYVGAGVVAAMAVAIRMATTMGPEADASSGMYAFGDALLFVFVFGLVALIPTTAALILLRPYPLFWVSVATLCVLVAATGVAAAALYAVGRHAVEPSPLATWASASVLRMLVAPLLTLTFLFPAFLSPHRVSRFMLFAAAAAEATVSMYAGLVWFVL